MTIKNIGDNWPDCSTAGKGFARTENSNIAPENCGLPYKGFNSSDYGRQDEETKEGHCNSCCSTAGKGYARSDNNDIAPDNCANPTKGYCRTDRD